MSKAKNRPLLITGCSSGIGLCVARALTKRGYPVYATTRREKDVVRLQAEGLKSLQLDLADSESITSAVDTILEQTDGKLYGLFNNGAYCQPGAVEDISHQVLREQFETNLFGWHQLTQRLIPVMRQQGEGRIIQNSSVLGFVTLSYRGAYNASKYALEGLSDTLRLELHGSNIHVSLIEPGPIESHFRRNAFAMYKKNIDPTNSHHRDTYQAMEERLTKEGPVMPFTLPPEAVLKRVIHALESPRPQARYYVTFPTYLFGILKRLLPIRAMDWVLRRV
ncbi:MAG: SDR family oxidoreductase [Sedimenticola sp.]